MIIQNRVHRTVPQRAMSILREEGAVSLIKRALLSSGNRMNAFVKNFFWHGAYYIYEKPLGGMDEADESKFIPRIQNCSLKIISTPEQIDELITEGYNISFRPDTYELKKRISKGTIAFCAFVEQDFAHITYVALNEEAKQDVDVNPFSVDFSNKEVCSGASETNPKYRRMGIYAYVYSRIFRFLSEEGLLIDRFAISKDNIASRNALAKFNPSIYKEVHTLHLLRRWTFRIEKPTKWIRI